MAKGVTNKLTFKNADMIPSSARDAKADKLMVIQPFGLRLDFMFKTDGQAASKSSLMKLEIALAKVVKDFSKKMGEEVATVQKDVVKLHDLDKKGDKNAAKKAAAACSGAVKKLEGTLFDQMRDTMRRTADKQLSASKDTKFIAKSIETAGMSGFRNFREADPLVRADHVKDAIAKLDIFDRGFQHVRGDGFTFVRHPLSRHRKCRTGEPGSA